MSSAVVQPGQTLEDIAIQYCGSEESVFALATLNGLGFTDDVTPGQELILPTVAVPRAVKVLSDGDFQPATWETDTAAPEGIGYWIIGDDFIVS